MRPRFHLAAAEAIAVVLASALEAQAQGSAEIARCRSLVASLDRLACYDKLTLPASPAGSRSYRAMSLTDLKLDQGSLRGLGVEVAGTLVPLGETAVLRSSDTDLSPLFVELTAVPHEQRRAFLERCGMLGCSVTIRGLVAPVMAQPGIVADSLEIR